MTYLETKQTADKIAKIIKQNQTDSREIKLSIGLHKIKYDKNANGNDARYLKVFVKDTDISTLVSQLVNKPLSKAKDTNNTVIVHGSGMDMGYYLLTLITEKMYENGYKNLIYREDYKYLGRYNNYNNKYPHGD